MVTTVQRWRNSLAIRIPKTFAAQANLDEGSRVEVSIEGGRIIVAPARMQWQLNDLVKKISRANLHPQVEWSPTTRSITK
jgi:antitoxin MazE